MSKVECWNVQSNYIAVVGLGQEIFAASPTSKGHSKEDALEDSGRMKPMCMQVSKGRAVVKHREDADIALA
jgi:hypothetical protein